MVVSLFMDSGATFSPCGKYRHALWRIWDESLPLYMTVMLNPSTAGAVESDPTVSRQITRAQMLGYGGLLVGNAFDFRATDPKVMKAAEAPCSTENDRHLLEMAARAGIIVCAWGKDGAHLGRGAEVLALLGGYDLYALHINEDGSPGHPLYLSYKRVPVLWRSRL